MQLVLNLEKETVEDLRKSINIISQVIHNKENNQPLTNGLQQYANGHAQQAQEPSIAVKKFQEQQVDQIDLSKMLRNNFR